MRVKYNGFTCMPAELKRLLPAVILLASACSSEPPQPEPAAAAETPAATDNQPPQPVNDVAQAVAAADVSLRPDSPLIYVVKKGDTLWDISGHFLNDPWQWPELWYSNSQIKNPHRIYPGDRLRLVWVNGRPRLTREGDFFGSSGKLEPRIREEPLDREIPAIPIDAIREFLRSPRLITAEQMVSAPYIVDFTDEHVAAGANDGIFVKNLPADGLTNWSVVEPGEPYKDPDTGEVLGYEAIPVGDAELRAPGQTAALVMTTSTREARKGDRLLPVDKEDFNAYFYPHAPKNPVTGRIISVFDGMLQIPIYQVVAINRGSNDGVDPGTVFSIMLAGKAVKDPYGPDMIQLPDQPAGQLIVFKTTPRLSYALVVRTERPSHVFDKIAPPVPKRY